MQVKLLKKDHRRKRVRGGLGVGDVANMYHVDKFSSQRPSGEELHMNNTTACCKQQSLFCPRWPHIAFPPPPTRSTRCRSAGPPYDDPAPSSNVFIVPTLERRKWMRLAGNAGSRSWRRSVWFLPTSAVHPGNCHTTTSPERGALLDLNVPPTAREAQHGESTISKNNK